jgi:hypothetical protein
LVYESLNSVENLNFGVVSEKNLRAEQEDTATIATRFLSRDYSDSEDPEISANSNSEKSGGENPDVVEGEAVLFRMVEDVQELNGLLLQMRGGGGKEGEAEGEAGNDEVTAEEEEPEGGELKEIKIDGSVDDRSIYLGVYDGHGGSAVSFYLKHHLHKAVKREIESGLKREKKEGRGEENLEEVIVEAFKRAFYSANEVSVLPLGNRKLFKFYFNN